MKFKKNDKGFSLVELIIVIAIMVALVAVLAPQFTKYVDKSRQAVDTDTVEQLVASVKVCIADDSSNAIAKGVTITLSDGAAVVANAEGGDSTSAGELEKALEGLLGTGWKDTTKLKANNASATITVSEKDTVTSSLAFEAASTSPTAT